MLRFHLILRDAHYHGSAELGHVGYKYAHDYPNHYVDQQYLPDAIKDLTFYEPGDNGYETDIKKWFEKIKENKRGINGRRQE